MMDMIDQYLTRSAIKDAMKGGNGWRSLREIANACAPTRPDIPRIAKQLDQSVDTGLAEMALFGPERVYRTAKSLLESRQLHPHYIP